MNYERSFRLCAKVVLTQIKKIDMPSLFSDMWHRRNATYLDQSNGLCIFDLVIVNNFVQWKMAYHLRIHSTTVRSPVHLQWDRGLQWLSNFGSSYRLFMTRSPALLCSWMIHGVYYLYMHASSSVVYECVRECVCMYVWMRRRRRQMGVWTARFSLMTLR